MTAVKNAVNEENFWYVFGSAAKNRHGKLADLNAVDKSHGKTVEMLRRTGIIKTGQGFFGDTYKITKTGLNWVEALFGSVKDMVKEHEIK